MPNYRPPEVLTGTPGKVTLARGTLLYRVHGSHRAAADFNTKAAHCLYGGGRFDATDHEGYGYLYTGLSAAAAVCETLLRSLPFDPLGGPRLLQRAAVEGRRLSTLRLTADVCVLPLMSARDLAAVHQDTWLVHTEAHDYPYTRHWAHWIRRHTEPWAQGLVWSSKREPADRTLVLFGDRCPAGTLRPEEEGVVDFDTADGQDWLNSALLPYHVQLAP
ncbi:RES family NAD+ phosphorylase [Streptomyces cellulosae]|uniref:RES family NAD+ phosphorylase n=1 Tax=Streptomyces cellulosae TaxID=1968 RepID=UPI00225ACDAA|nr:RES family NAD+ phosphorylase [Streptomyces cellulosae]WTB88912.1 RES family NAD+ phosphorylase [Streptomyces cellulosae]WTC56203.1 RES family NAD+ phosphorylase [Streptomyces cellulosae]